MSNYRARPGQLDLKRKVYEKAGVFQCFGLMMLEFENVSNPYQFALNIQSANSCVN